jgi:hypothetical protein
MKASLLCSCVGIINGVVLVVGRTRRHKSIERVVSSIPAAQVLFRMGWRWIVDGKKKVKEENKFQFK